MGYVYDKVLTAIDYCGDIRKGGGTYHADFSPNNIRRLIISENGCIVNYHVSTKHCTKEKIVTFALHMVGKDVACENGERYKAGVSALVADRLCASVEEVILVGRQDFVTYEMTGLQKFIRDDGKSKIRRLAGVASYVGGDLSFYRKGYDGLFCEELEKLGAEVQWINRDSYWRYYGTSAQFYALDAEGSLLNRHFKKIIERHSESSKAEDLKEYKRERNGELISAFDKEYKRSCDISTYYGEILRYVKKHGTNEFFGLGVERIERLQLPQGLEGVDGLSVSSKGLIILVEGKKYPSESDLLKESLEVIKQWNIGVHRIIGSLVNRGITEHPQVVKSLLKIEPALASVNIEGCAFDGIIGCKRFDTSMRNLFALYSFMVLDRGSVKFFLGNLKSWEGRAKVDGKH